MVSKLMRARLWILGLVLAVVAGVGVWTAVDVFADIGAGGSDRPCVGECDKAAWPVWRFGSWSSPDDFVASESKDTGWSWGSAASQAAGEAYDRALRQCKATDSTGKCENPVIAAAGYMTVLRDGSPSGVADDVVTDDVASMKSIWSQAYGDQGFESCHTWLLNDERRVNSCSKMGGSASVNTRASQDSNYSTSTLVVMVVLSQSDVNTSMTGEDCTRIVTGQLDRLHWGPDGIWSYDDASGGHYEDLVRSLTTEDAAGNSLKNLQGGTGHFVWDSTHVWDVNTSPSAEHDLKDDINLVPGVSGHIQGVIDSNSGGVPSVIYGSGGVWLYDDDSRTVIKKLDGVAGVSTVVTGGIQGDVWGYAVSSDAVWLFDQAGNARKIMDSVSGVAPSGKIVGVSGASRRMLVYGKQGAWLVWLGAGRFVGGCGPASGVDFGSVSEGSIHVERISTDDVVVARDNFYVTADGSAKYLDFYYDLRGSNTSCRSDVGYELRDVTGDQLSGVKGSVSGDGTFVYSDTAAWTLSFGSISYVEDKPDAVGKSIRYAVAKRVPGITGKIIGTRQSYSYGNAEVVTTDGIWAFNRSGSFVLPDGLPSGLKPIDGYYPGKGEYATPYAIREPVVVSSMSVSNGYFVDLNGNQIKVDGKPVKSFKLTRFVKRGGLGDYGVYGGSRYYFTYHDDRGYAFPVNVNKTPLMCYAVSYVVKAGDKDVTSETDAPGTQFVLWGRSLTLPALHKLPDGWRFDDKWCQGYYYCDYAVNTVFTPTGDVTFETWLKPVVHLSFNLSEAEGQPDASKTPATQALRQGQLGVKPTPDPSWTGRHFENWYLKNGDGSRGGIWDFRWRTVDSDTTLYARWQVKQFFKSTVDGCKLDDWRYTHDRTFDYGSKAESVGDPSCGKADFVGWVKDDPKSSVVVDDLSTVTLDKDTTFYAKWAPKQVKLSFRKVDAADHGKHLSGAEFTITGPGLSEPLKVTSNDDGMVNFRLPTSDSPYLVTESKAPEGYSGEVSFKLTVPSSDWRDFGLSDVTCSDGGSACLSGSAGDFLDESDDDGPDGYVNDLSNIADIDHFPQTGRGGVAVFPFVGGLLIIVAGIIAVVLWRRGHGVADGSGNGVVDSVSDSVSAPVDPVSVSGDPFKSVDVEIPVSHPVDGEL